MNISESQLRKIIRREILSKNKKRLINEDACPLSANQSTAHQAVKDMQRIFSGKHARHRINLNDQGDAETSELDETGCWYGGSRVGAAENTQNAWKKFLRKIWGRSKANSFNGWRSDGHTNASAAMDAGTGEAWVKAVNPSGYGPYTNDHAGALQFVIDSIAARNLKDAEENPTETEEEEAEEVEEEVEEEVDGDDGDDDGGDDEGDSASTDTDSLAIVCIGGDGVVVAWILVSDTMRSRADLESIESWYSNNCSGSSVTLIYESSDAAPQPQQGQLLGTPSGVTAICATWVQSQGRDNEVSFSYWFVHNFWTGTPEGVDYDAWSQACGTNVPGARVVRMPFSPPSENTQNPEDQQSSEGGQSQDSSAFDDDSGHGSRGQRGQYDSYEIVNDNREVVFRVWTTSRNLDRIRERTGAARRWRRDALLNFNRDQLADEDDVFIISWGAYPGMRGYGGPADSTYGCTEPIQVRITDLIGLEYEDNLRYRDLPENSMWKRIGENLKDLKRLAGREAWERPPTDAYPQGRFYREKTALAAITSRDSRYEMLEVETGNRGKVRYYRPSRPPAGDNQYPLNIVVRSLIDEICAWYKQYNTPLDMGQEGTRTARRRVRRTVRRGGSDTDTGRMQGRNRRG